MTQVDGPTSIVIFRDFGAESDRPDSEGCADSTVLHYLNLRERAERAAAQRAESAAARRVHDQLASHYARRRRVGAS